MARRRSSVFEDLVALSSRLPWQVGMGLALAAYIALHLWASTPALTAPPSSAHMGAFALKEAARNVAGLMQYLVPLFILVGVGIGAIKRRQGRQLHQAATAKPTAAAVDGMSWRQFEQLLAEAFRRQGWRVTETGGNGPDGGVDLELSRDGKRHLVQCKHWRAQRVGVDVVRQLYGVMAARGAAGGWVVTSGRYTDEAQRFAEGRNLRLVDGRASG